MLCIICLTLTRQLLCQLDLFCVTFIWKRLSSPTRTRLSAFHRLYVIRYSRIVYAVWAAFTKVSHLNSSASITTTGCPIGYTDRLITERSLFPSHPVTTTVKRGKKNRLLSCKRIKSKNGKIQNYKHHWTTETLILILNTSYTLQMYKKYSLSLVKIYALLNVKTHTVCMYLSTEITKLLYHDYLNRIYCKENIMSILWVIWEQIPIKSFLSQIIAVR